MLEHGKQKSIMPLQMASTKRSRIKPGTIILPKKERVSHSKAYRLASKKYRDAQRFFKNRQYRFILFPKGDVQFSKQFFLRATVLILFFGSLYLWFITHDLPSPEKLSSKEIPLTTHIYDRNGKLLYNIYTDKNRTIVRLSDIPDSLRKATIAVEDKDFYRHRGFDPTAIVRALGSIVFHKELQGGSTITQQLVKTVFLSPERTVNRKVKELYLALQVETTFSKDEILQNYLNNVPYGGTAWGVEAAAETYFGKPARDLSLAESALLAGLPASPTTYSPFGANPGFAKERQKEVLSQMVTNGFIDKKQADEASKEPLRFTKPKTDIFAPHFVAYVKDLLAQKYGEKLVEQGGLKVTTTLDLDMQEKTQAIVSEEVSKLTSLNVGNGAALVTNPKTGEILSMVGSRDYFDKSHDGNVNLTTALRQPGSSIKPINYAKAFIGGLTPATIVVDAPTSFSNGPGQKPYTPVNYDGKYHGAQTLRSALASSYNIPAVKVLAYNGVGEMIDLATKMGITTFTDPARYGLSLTLGGGEVKMVDMATAFGTFANLGERHDLVAVLKVEDKNGKVLEQFTPSDGKKVIPPGVAFQISNILADNESRTPAFGPSSYLVVGGKVVSVKTGTTDNKRDNWTIGYTPSRLAAVWVGNNDNSPMNPYLTSGVTGAAPIWNRIMRDILKDRGVEVMSAPKDIVALDICALTGGLPSPGCPTKKEYFLVGTQPKNTIFAKQKVWVDPQTGKLTEPGAPNALEKETVVVSDFYKPSQGYCAGCIVQEVTPTSKPPGD